MTNTNSEDLPKSSAKLTPWEGSSTFVNQGAHWSSAFIWITSSLFGFTLLWAFTSKIDQTISVRGVLNPLNSTRSVESPSSGIISNVFVDEGEYVSSGSPLVQLQSDTLISRQKAISDTLALLSFESKALTIIVRTPSVDDSITLISNLPFPKLLTTSNVDRFITARDQFLQITAQLQQLNNRLNSKTESLRLQRSISQDLKPLYEGGGLSRNAYLQQLDSLQVLMSEISSLQDEKSRIIGAASTRLNNLNKQVINLKSEDVRVDELLRNQTVKSPINGTVFDLRVSPNSVVGNEDVILKVVPSGPLSASLKIPNSDIGFVKPGQSVSISVDSFPPGEFGYINATLSRIGSDSLPPDESSPTVYFPAYATLNAQTVVSGSNQLNLQSGMSVTANIKLRARPTISIVTDLFTRQLEGVKTFR